MPRRPRDSGQLDHQILHVLNRGNGRMNLFSKDGDFAAFVALIEAAPQRFPSIRILAFV